MSCTSATLTTTTTSNFPTFLSFLQTQTQTQTKTQSKFEAGEHKTMGEEAWSEVTRDTPFASFNISEFLSTSKPLSYGDVMAAAGDFVAAPLEVAEEDTGSL